MTWRLGPRPWEAGLHPTLLQETQPGSGLITGHARGGTALSHIRERAGATLDDAYFGAFVNILGGVPTTDGVDDPPVLWMGAKTPR